MEKSQVEKLRLNVWLNPELIRKAKAFAALAGKTLAEIVEEALRDKLQKK